MKTIDLTKLKIPEQGLRPESFEYLRKGGKAYGGKPSIGVQHDGTMVIWDGRHRLLLAREARKPIEVVVRRYGPRGGLRSCEHCIARV